MRPGFVYPNLIYMEEMLMKKILSLVLTALLALSICFSAGAETSALTLTCPSGAPALAVAAMAAEHPANFSFIAADTIAATPMKSAVSAAATSVKRSAEKRNSVRHS